MDKECMGNCPFCGSQNIDYGTSNVLDETLIYPAICENCNKYFEEHYAIVYDQTHYYND